MGLLFAAAGRGRDQQLTDRLSDDAGEGRHSSDRGVKPTRLSQGYVRLIDAAQLGGLRLGQACVQPRLPEVLAKDDLQIAVRDRLLLLGCWRPGTTCHGGAARGSDRDIEGRSPSAGYDTTVLTKAAVSAPPQALSARSGPAARACDSIEAPR